MVKPDTDRQNERRSAIVSVARAAFISAGYAGTTMSSIAAQLGGSKTTLWAYFRNKEELFSAVVDELIDQFGDVLRVPLPADGDVREVLLGLSTAMMKTLLTPEIVALHRLVVGEAGRFPELGQMVLERGPKVGESRIANWFSTLMAQGRMKQCDAGWAAVYFSAACQGGIVMRHIQFSAPRPSRHRIQAEAESLVAIFMRGFDMAVR